VAAVSDTVLFFARRHIMMVQEGKGQLVSSVSLTSMLNRCHDKSLPGNPV
jgi:hypothetical protein